jgi:Tfp pilus assembly pilus retraction ATPase PilT
MRTPYSHILTVEDPIEFVHQSKKCLINQREVGPHTLSFQNALRSALREDPDVILVGEMRDLETIRLALTGAETGHLVFATLHTSSAAKTIDRIVDVFPAAEKEMVRSMLSESLRAVISQTLLKTKDGQGRVAAHEILIGTPAIRNLIRENKVAQMYSALQTGQQFGMQTLDQCLLELVKRNIVSASRGARQGRQQGRLRRRLSQACEQENAWKRSGTEIHARTAATDDAEERLRPLHHGQFSAGDQDRRQGDTGFQPAAPAAALRRTRALDHERPSGLRFRSHQGMQLRHLAPGHRPLPRQCAGAAGAGRRRLPHDQPGGTDPRRTRLAAGAQGHRDDQARGLVIFVGGTGTGKTTSLAALVDHRNRNSHGHIITIEDPIEFVHEHKNCIVTQREVGVDTDSWEAALKNTLRQAPNVIMMGEIRDRETMDYAVAFAETGHLCLATLHANSANQAIDRIINFFPEERRHQLLMDLSLNLRALVSQRLLPKKDGKGGCRRSRSCSTRRSFPT